MIYKYKLFSVKVYMNTIFATGLEHEFRVRCANKITEKRTDFEKVVLEMNNNKPSYIFINSYLLFDILNEIYEKILFENILNKKIKINKLKKNELDKFYSYIAITNLFKKRLSPKITKLIKDKERFNYIYNKNYILYNFPLLELNIKINYNDFGDTENKMEKIKDILTEKDKLLKTVKSKSSILAYKKHEELGKLQRRILTILNKPNKISSYSKDGNTVDINYTPEYKDENAKYMLKNIKRSIKNKIENTLLSYSFIINTEIDKKDLDTLTEMLLRKDKIPEVDYSDKSQSLEYKTLRYKNLPFSKAVEDLKRYEDVSLKVLEKHKAINNLIEDYGELTYHNTGSLGKTIEIIDYQLNKKGDLSWDFKEIPLDYSGSYHIWLTVPYTPLTKPDVFVESHIFMANMLQMLEPILMANYGSPPVDGIGNNQLHARSSLRQMINIYGGIGTSDLTLMRGSKKNYVEKLFLRKSDILNNNSIEIDKYNKVYDNNKMILNYNGLTERVGTSNNLMPFPVATELTEKKYNIKNYFEVVLEKSKIDMFKDTRKKLFIGADIRTGMWSKNYEKPLMKDIEPINLLEGKKIRRYYYDTKNKKVYDRRVVDNNKYKKFLKNRMGFEFRIMDHIPTYRLDEILPIISLLMVHSNLNYKKLSGKNMVINKQFYHNTVADVIIKGYETTFNKSFLKYLEKQLMIKLDKNKYRSDELLNEIKIKLLEKYENNKITKKIYNFKRALPIHSFSKKVWMKNLENMIEKSAYLGGVFNKLNINMTDKEMINVLGKNWVYDIEKVRDYLKERV